MNSANKLNAEVKGLLEEGDVATAWALLKEEIDTHPDNLLLNLLEGLVIESRDGYAAAKQHYLKLINTHEKSPKPHFRLAIIAVKQGDLECAAHQIAEAQAKGLPTLKVNQLQLQIAGHKNDYDSERKLLEQRIDLLPEHKPELLLRLANLYYKLEDYDASLNMADRLLPLDNAHSNAHGLAAKAALKGGHAERAESELDWLLAAEPENLRWLNAMLHLYAMTDCNDKAVALIRDAGERGLSGFELYKNAKRFRLPEDISTKVIAWAESLGTDATTKERTLAAELLLSYGRKLPPLFDEKNHTQSDEVDSVNDWIKNAPADAELKRALVDDDGKNEIVIASSAHPEAIVLFFTGLSDRTMGTIPLFDRYLSALNLSAVYLRAPSGFVFNKGIASVANDFPGTIVYLRKLLEEHGSPRLITMGSSAGGYAAIRYGLALKADCIVGFSAPTNITADFVADDKRGRLVVKRIQTLPAEALDLRPVVQAAGGAIPIHLVYGENHYEDSRHANYIKEERGVVLHPLHGVEVHTTLTVLARENKLLQFLSDTLDFSINSAHRV